MEEAVQRKPILVFSSVAFGLVAFLIAVALGTVLTASTGIPLIGGLLNGIVTAAVLTIGLLATRYAGSATTMWLVFSVAAIPTTTLGPPGVYKVCIGVLAGLLWDAIYMIARRHRIALYVGAVVGSASIMFSLVAALSMGFGRDASAALEKYRAAFLMLLAVNLLITLIGVWFGDYSYSRRLKDLPAFKNLARHAE
ncbi:MAG TPA: hypothetical protein VGF28_11065 [Thermoanaerobaculia bacterium]|jgi:hypothetical protein